MDATIWLLPVEFVGSLLVMAYMEFLFQNRRLK